MNYHFYRDTHVFVRARGRADAPASARPCVAVRARAREAFAAAFGRLLASVPARRIAVVSLPPLGGPRDLL